MYNNFISVYRKKMASAKFNSRNLPNPYGELDNDFGDEDCLFNTIQDDHMFVVPLTPAENSNISYMDLLLSLGGPTPSFKKSTATSDTTRDIEGSIIMKPDLSPVSRSPQSFAPSHSTNGDSKEFELMDLESSQSLADNSGDIESSPQRSIKLPKTKKIRSHDAKRSQIEESGEKRVKKYKKDERKNMYGYSFKFIVKEFLSDRYKGFFDKLCAKFGLTNQAEVRAFYEEKLRWSISLKDLRSFLNFNEHGPGESLRLVKLVFHSFYVWYMRKRYTLHILTEDKIVHKDPYLEAKNYLIYLPEIKDKCKSKAAPTSSDR